MDAHTQNLFSPHDVLAIYTTHPTNRGDGHPSKTYFHATDC
jgi:hypothetical protein